MMKFFKIYLFMTLMLLAISPLRMSSAPRKSPTTYVEVLYFHGKVRCQTCNDIEASASKVVRASFAMYNTMEEVEVFVNAVKKAAMMLR